MKILRGGSAEVRPTQWFKFDIELDESDLQALIVKHSLDGSNLTVIQKYKLLVKQAELLVTVEMEIQGLHGDKSSAELKQEFDTLINTLPKVG